MCCSPLLPNIDLVKAPSAIGEGLRRAGNDAARVPAWMLHLPGTSLSRRRKASAARWAI